MAWADQGSVLASGPVSVPGLRLVLTCCHRGVKEGRQEPVQSLLIVGGERGAQVGVESAGDVGGNLTLRGRHSGVDDREQSHLLVGEAGVLDEQ